MYILKVQAFGDFDCPYDITVCCSPDKHTIQRIRHALNDYCAKHPKVGMDVKLMTEFENPSSAIYDVLRDCVSEEQADKIYAKLEEICSYGSVLIYGDIFEVEEILNI